MFRTFRRRRRDEALGVPARVLQRDVFEQFTKRFAAYGYDGRGVTLVSPGGTDVKDAKKSCKLAMARGIRLYAEARVSFARASSAGFDAAGPVVVS